MVHQAILGVTLLARLPAEAFCLFSQRYNVPEFLRQRFPDMSWDPITCRYDESAFFQNPVWLADEAETNAKINTMLEKFIS